MKTSKKYITEAYTRDIQKSLSSEFDCGNDALTSFLKNYESLDNMFGKTYVMISENKIVGYYNISTGCVEENTGVRMGGTIYINCFAVDKRFQKIKRGKYYISDIILADCITRINNIYDDFLGFSFITLSSTEEGRHLYERNSFLTLEEDMRIAKNSGELRCVPMYLPIDYE